MIAAWMLGSTLFALLLCVAAYAGEHALRLTGRATRTPWVGALVLAVVWPALAPVVLHRIATSNESAAFIVDGSTASAATLIAQQLPANAASWRDVATVALLVVWGAMSVLLLARLFLAARTLARVTRTATPMHLDGEPVLVTETLGPAVIGLWTPQVAVPEWFLQLDAPLRTLVLRHEREHCVSRDPQLVWLASIATALMPWNIGVWTLARRMRLALEIDCDARTLRQERTSERYGKLLLLIAQRQSSFPLAAMLAESSSHLSRRITAMQMKPLQKPVVRVLAFSAIAAGAVAIACSPRIASDLTAPQPKDVSASSVKLAAEHASGGQVFYESQVEQPVKAAAGSVGPAYPAALRAQGVEGRVLAMFVVNEQGLAEPASFKVVQADNPEFEAAVKNALPNMRFEPAKIGDRVVKQLVQQPFMFALGKGSAAAPTPARVAQPSSAAQGATPQFYAGSLKSGAGPVYPAALKAKGVEGGVTVMFVINRDGSPDLETLKVLKSDDPEFTAAVRTALGEMRYEPPMKDGVAVRQLAQQRFDFKADR